MIVVIDPGHGGRDPGAVGKKSLESDLNFQIAKKLKDQLEGYPEKHKVILTRPDFDTFIDLYGRAEVANKAKAALFISIHCNGTDNHDAEGFEIYHWPRSKRGQEWATKIHSVTKSLYKVDRGIKSDTFAVLHHTECPAVLIECGFITNEQEENRLNDPRYQLSLAKAIASVIK